MKIHLRSVQLCVGVITLLVAVGSVLRADEQKAGPQLFDSPQAAMEALVVALAANDDAALKAMAGPGSEDVVLSGSDPIVARERRRVATMAREKIAFETLDDGTQVAVLGMKAWPMPLSIATKDGKWFFDVVQARDELLARRIGQNELRVIDIMRVLVEAQAAYRSQDRDGDGVLEYAQRFISSPNSKDGLFWLDPPDVSLEDRSPLGAMVEELSGRVGDTGKPKPFSGYYFKLLTAQGRSVPGGAHCFNVGANMSRGFAVLAVPAQYRNTGVKSFMISHHGRLFERDLGPQGLERARGITVFEPGATWVRLGNP